MKSIVTLMTILFGLNCTAGCASKPKSEIGVKGVTSSLSENQKRCSNMATFVGMVSEIKSDPSVTKEALLTDWSNSKNFDFFKVMISDMYDYDEIQSRTHSSYLYAQCLRAPKIFSDPVSIKHYYTSLLECQNTYSPEAVGLMKCVKSAVANGVDSLTR